MITQDEVRHIARLARLSLSKKEEKNMTKQLYSILEHIDKLRDLNTDNVQPTVHAVEVSNVLGNDTIAQSLPTLDVLKNAPQSDSNFFVVPKVLES